MPVFAAIGAALVGAGASTFMAGLAVPAIAATHKEIVSPKRKKAPRK